MLHHYFFMKSHSHSQVFVSVYYGEAKVEPSYLFIDAPCTRSHYSRFLEVDLCVFLKNFHLADNIAKLLSGVGYNHYVFCISLDVMF